jgi:hypothetical protein
MYWLRCKLLQRWCSRYLQETCSLDCRLHGLMYVGNYQNFCGFRQFFAVFANFWRKNWRPLLQNSILIEFCKKN